MNDVQVESANLDFFFFFSQIKMTFNLEAKSVLI